MESRFELAFGCAVDALVVPECDSAGIYALPAARTRSVEIFRTRVRLRISTPSVGDSLLPKPELQGSCLLEVKFIHGVF